MTTDLDKARDILRDSLRYPCTCGTCLQDDEIRALLALPDDELRAVLEGDAS